MPSSDGVMKFLPIRAPDVDRHAGQLIAKAWGLKESEFWRQFLGIYPEGTKPDLSRTNKLRQEYDHMRAKLRTKK